MKKLIVSTYTIILLFIASTVFADHDQDASSTQLKLALDFSGNKLHVSSIKLQKNIGRLGSLRIILEEKKKKKEISDDEYDAKIEVIKECEEECKQIDADIVELKAVIKIKHEEFPKASVEIKINDQEKEHDQEKEEEHDREEDHHKHKHKHHQHECPECKHEHHDQGNHYGHHKHHENEQ